MSRSRAPRNSLTQERIISAALELADTEGLEGLTIRRLADRLGVGTMSIYHYVPTKEALLDALVNAVFAELHVPETTRPWREELDARARSMRAALARHPWALPLMEARATPGPANLRNHEAVLEVLRSSGFAVAAAGHAYAILDAFVYGFALQEAMLSTVGLRETTAETIEIVGISQYSRMMELATHFAQSKTYPLDESYEIGLRIALDGIASLPLEPSSG